MAHGFDVFLFQHLGIHGCLIGVLRIDVPRSESNVVELCQRNNLAVVQVFLFITTANTYLVVLGHGSDRFGQSFAGH